MSRMNSRSSNALSPEKDGMYRWVLWAILVLPYLVVYFHRLSIGVLRAPLAAEFALSATGFAQIGAAYFYTYAFLQIPAGILSDSLGPRRTVTAAALITALGTTVFATAGSAGMLFLGRFIIGIGVSAVFISILKVLAVWFREGEFATLTGLTAGVGTLGAIGAQTPLLIASERWGWRAAFLAVAVFSVLTALLCYTMVRDKGPEQEKHETHLLRELGTTIKNRRTWPPWLVFFGVYGAFIALSGTWGQSYLVYVLAIPARDAANLLTTSVVGIAVGGLIFAFISDRTQRRKVPMIVWSSACLVLWVVFVGGWVDTLRGLHILMLGIGLSSGVVLTALPCGKEVNHPAFSGTSTAVVNVGGFLGSALIPVAMGRVLDLAAPELGEVAAYRYALYVCVLAVGLGVLGAALVTETRCRNIYFTLKDR